MNTYEFMALPVSIMLALIMGCVVVINRIENREDLRSMDCKSKGGFYHQGLCVKIDQVIILEPSK